MMFTPHDDNASLMAFYGDPSSRVFAMNLVPFVPPWRMLYQDDNNKIIPVSHFVVHRKAIDAFTAAFAATWVAYAKNQSAIELDNLHWYGGCYAPRDVRGSATKISVHAFAAAIDIDPEHNPLNRIHAGKMPAKVVDIFKSAGFFWGGNFISRQDPMHFQLAHE